MDWSEIEGRRTGSRFVEADRLACLALWSLERVLLYGAWSMSCSMELGACLALCICEECEA